MSVLAPKPIHWAVENPTLKRLLNSEATSLLKIHPKTSQKVPVAVKLPGADRKLSRFASVFELVAATNCRTAERAFLFMGLGYFVRLSSGENAAEITAATTATATRSVRSSMIL